MGAAQVMPLGPTLLFLWGNQTGWETFHTGGLGFGLGSGLGWGHGKCVKKKAKAKNMVSHRSGKSTETFYTLTVLAILTLLQHCNNVDYKCLR